MTLSLIVPTRMSMSLPIKHANKNPFPRFGQIIMVHALGDKNFGEMILELTENDATKEAGLNPFPEKGHMFRVQYVNGTRKLMRIAYENLFSENNTTVPDYIDITPDKLKPLMDRISEKFPWKKRVFSRIHRQNATQEATRLMKEELGLEADKPLTFNNSIETKHFKNLIYAIKTYAHVSFKPSFLKNPQHSQGPGNYNEVIQLLKKASQQFNP